MKTSLLAAKASVFAVTRDYNENCSVPDLSFQCITGCGKSLQSCAAECANDQECISTCLSLGLF